MQTRARQILALIAVELEKRDSAIEQDLEITKLTIEVEFGNKSRIPIHVHYLSKSVTELRQTKFDL